MIGINVIDVYHCPSLIAAAGPDHFAVKLAAITTALIDNRNVAASPATNEVNCNEYCQAVKNGFLHCSHLSVFFARRESHTLYSRNVYSRTKFVH